MSSNEIRKFITLIESAGFAHNEQILNEIFENSELDENIVQNIKNKVAQYSEKLGTLGNSLLPQLQQKIKSLIEPMREKYGDELTNMLLTALKKQAGSNWLKNAGQVAAALAILTTLVSSPANANDLITRLATSGLAGMQYAQTRPGYMVHKDPRVVSGQMSPEQALALQQQQQMSGQQIPQHVMNALVGAALNQLIYPHRTK